MIKKAILAAVLTAVSLWSNIASAAGITEPLRLNDYIRFYGDFSPSPSARQEVHNALVKQWEYLIVKSADKSLIENGAITSFDLQENTGEDFRGYTGYTMIYLDDDPNKRISTIKSLATKYNGNPDFVSQKVEEYLDQSETGMFPIVAKAKRQYGGENSGTAAN
ncbi:hypothetical protein [Brevibacillus fulvus]|uniref:Uncharacterized protein n=1 Tax=Brevibacillus fulvus TaxID=1125967 RepID=A0A939BQZ3_9BACL|nr:hypothetical protein [Brevibacillus fulvus]MBM7588933.1 hypothetical protein [Brevibacillus fulvus]